MVAEDRPLPTPRFLLGHVDKKEGARAPGERASPRRGWPRRRTPDSRQRSSGPSLSAPGTNTPAGTACLALEDKEGFRQGSVLEGLSADAASVAVQRLGEAHARFWRVPPLSRFRVDFCASRITPASFEARPPPPPPQERPAAEAVEVGSGARGIPHPRLRAAAREGVPPHVPREVRRRGTRPAIRCAACQGRQGEGRSRRFVLRRRCLRRSGRGCRSCPRRRRSCWACSGRGT